MKTIVVAEDFATARKVIVNTLSKNENYQILEAEDGAEALKLFDNRQVDLLVTDFNMPHMNGAELIEEVRKKDKYKYIPVIVLSTEISEEKKQSAINAQITAWVAKPYDIMKFVKIINKALK